MPEDRLGLALARVNGSEKINHMVGFYTDPWGRSFSIGDTFAPMRPMLTFSHHYAYWTFLDDMQHWLRVETKNDLRNPSLAVVEANRSNAQ